MTCDPTGRLSELPTQKFSDETIVALVELGNALLVIHNRIAAEKGEPVSKRIFVAKPPSQDFPKDERLAA